MRDVEEAERDDEVELIATLAATSVNPVELDALAAELERVAGVRHATWGSRSED